MFEVAVVCCVMVVVMNVYMYLIDDVLDSSMKIVSCSVDRYLDTGRFVRLIARWKIRQVCICNGDSKIKSLLP